MKKIFLGPEAWSSIAGYVLSALTVLNDLHNKGETDAVTICLAVGIALAGRAVQFSKKKDGDQPQQ